MEASAKGAKGCPDAKEINMLTRMSEHVSFLAHMQLLGRMDVKEYKWPILGIVVNSRLCAIHFIKGAGHI
jgi:hypothetical protein